MTSNCKCEPATKDSATKDYSKAREDEVMQGITPQAARFIREAIQFDPIRSDLLDMILKLSRGVKGASDLETQDGKGFPVSQRLTECAQVVYILERLTDKGGPTCQQLFNLIGANPSETTVEVDTTGRFPSITISIAPLGGVAPFGEVTLVDVDHPTNP